MITVLTIALLLATGILAIPAWIAWKLLDGFVNECTGTTWRKPDAKRTGRAAR